MTVTQIGDLLLALHAPALGYKLCIHHLSRIVTFYVAQNAPYGVVEPLQEALARFGSRTWAVLFPQLALPQQLYAVSMSGTLLRQVEAPAGLPLTAEQVVRRLLLASRRPSRAGAFSDAAATLFLLVAVTSSRIHLPDELAATRELVSCSAGTSLSSSLPLSLLRDLG